MVTFDPTKPRYCFHGTYVGVDEHGGEHLCIHCESGISTLEWHNAQATKMLWRLINKWTDYHMIAVRHKDWSFFQKCKRMLDTLSKRQLFRWNSGLMYEEDRNGSDKLAGQYMPLPDDIPSFDEILLKEKMEEEELRLENEQKARLESGEYPYNF